jgi:hypothetical protein
VFFHAGTSSQDILIVIEIAALRNDTNTGEERYASLGWTYFTPFNPSKGGIDPTTIWKSPGSNKANQTFT